MKGQTAVNRVRAILLASAISVHCNPTRTIVAADMRDTSPVRSGAPRSVTVAYKGMYDESLNSSFCRELIQEEMSPVSITTLSDVSSGSGSGESVCEGWIV